MERLLYTYALIMSLYDEKRDYIECFWPFVMRTLDDVKPIKSDRIQRALADNFELQVPLHVIKTVLGRARKNRLADEAPRTDPKEIPSYLLTPLGKKQRDRLESEPEVQRRINALLQDIKVYFRENGVESNQEETYQLLMTFVRGNLDDLMEFVNPSATPRSCSRSPRSANERLLSQYLMAAENSKPEHYETFRHVVLGSIVSVVLSTSTPTEANELQTRRFPKMTVFLDTNFLLSIFGLHQQEYCDAARELLALMHKNDIHLAAFSFTIDELCSLLSQYPANAHRYPTNVRVNTIYSDLRRKGWKPSDATTFVMNIEKRLNKERIRVHWLKDINLKAYEPRRPDMRSKLATYKPGQGMISQNHDLAAVDSINQLRSRPFRRLEECPAIFLTSDGRLCRYDFCEMGHQESGTIAETISDRVLTTILWLKNPTATPPLKSIIASHSRDIMVKRAVWDRFYEVLKRLRQQERVNDEDLENLFYQGRIEENLSNLDRDQLEEITDASVLTDIEAAKQNVEARIHTQTKERDALFLDSLKTMTDEMEESRKKSQIEWAQRIEEIKRALHKSSETSAKRYVTSTRWILAFAVTGITFLIIFLWKQQVSIWGFIFAIIMFLVMLFFGSVGGFLDQEKEWLTSKFYTKRLQYTNLEEKSKDAG